MTRLLVASLCIAVSLDAAVVDRRAAVPPESVVVDAGAVRVVASETATFLAGAQRVSAEGVLLDPEPMTSAVGHAVAWPEGWLIVTQGSKRLYVRHLRETGEPELVLVAPGVDGLQDAASGAGRLVIVEIDRGGRRELVITISDGQEVLRQTRFGVSSQSARIARLGDGFVVALWSLDADHHRVLSILKVSADGDVIASRILEPRHTGGFSGDEVAVVSNGDRALILTGTSPLSRYRIVDEDLQVTAPVSFDQRTAKYSWGVPLPVGDGFMLSYTKNGEHRARIVRPDVSTVSDDPADPIAGGDRSRDRYLVVRPWGQAAVAEGDPRRVVTSAVQLKRREFEGWTRVVTTTSGDVTLVQVGWYSDFRQFFRVDADGNAIDEVRPLPRAYHQLYSPLGTVPTPDGFAFVWSGGGQVLYQRLSRRGGWIDPEPLSLGAVPGAVGFTLHANDRDLLLAWTTQDEILWRRHSHDGAALDVVPHRTAHVDPSRYDGRHRPSGISISGNGTERMITMQEGDFCVITCEDRLPLRLEVVMVDERGRMAGNLLQIDTDARMGALSLPDGSWALIVRDWGANGPDVIRISRSGHLIDRSSMPSLAGTIVDLEPTPSGWKAIVEGPLRLVELDGSARPIRMTGLELASSPRFSAGDRLVYLDGSPLLESVDVPWTGSLSSIEGDFSFTLRDLGTRGYKGNFSVFIRNEGTTDVSGIRVPLLLGNLVVPLLRPGEVYLINTTLDLGLWWPPIHAVSSDVTDTKPSDNSLSLEDAEPRPPRLHPVRP